MKKICAWCQTVLTPGEGTDPSEISHGICAACADLLESRLSRPDTLDSLLDRLEVPVLLVDGDAVVLTANRRARDLLGKDLPALRGHRGGEVLECAHARLPGGCGKTIHCQACAVRDAVISTHLDGRSRHRVEAYQPLVLSEKGLVNTRIIISTDRIDSVVLLRIEGINPQ